MDISDETLTVFLIDSLIASFAGAIEKLNPTEHPAENVRKSKRSEGGLLYLQMDAGSQDRWHTDIRVFTNGSDPRKQIWGMNIIAAFDTAALADAKLSTKDVHAFVNRTRVDGFIRTKERMRDGEKFSLLDIPAREEPAPVSTGGIPGSLCYNESSEDNLDFFIGEEHARFRAEGLRSTAITVFTAYHQGGRLR
jgi:hypothetical protein